MVGADLVDCQKIIVCDGYNVKENPKHKNYNRVGVVKPEQVAKYHEFMDNVCAVCSQPRRRAHSCPSASVSQCSMGRRQLALAPSREGVR